MEILSTLVKEHSEVSADADCRVEHSSTESDILSIKHGAGTYVRGSDNEAVDCLFFPEACFLFCLRQEEEGKEEEKKMAKDKPIDEKDKKEK